MGKLTLNLDDAQRITLEQMRDHHPKPYLREHAMGLLKVAAGQSIQSVAVQGLMKERQWETVQSWVIRYQQWGINGLAVQPGRGRKALFAPKSETDAQSEVAWVLHQSPHQFGLARARWRLQDVGRVLAWLNGASEAAIYKLLKRLGFSRKQALNFIHSPDPDYHAKWKAILQAYHEAVEHPHAVVLLFQDELTYYRQPSRAPAYGRRGRGHQPYAHQQPRPNTQTRLTAALNGVTGQVTYLQMSKVGEKALVTFYAQVQAVYPHARKIYLVQDNWPTHKLPNVMTAAHAQHLTPLFLPTYASWLNPIEKLWRWLKQAVLHLHALADQLDELREQVCSFLNQFNSGSDALLRYVGILPN